MKKSLFTAIILGSSVAEAKEAGVKSNEKICAS